jgi:DNA phosphorothioation-associated putative methyltransferase
MRDHHLVPLNDATHSEPSSTETLARHRTALQRYGLSTPMQALHRHDYLDGTRTVFDYGCGKGDDIRILHANGIAATGWDPHFAPDAPKTAADIVNLGFVINVIEDPAERTRVLRHAYHLARRLLSVSAMLTGREQPNGEQYSDGVRTSRNTFQRYYTQRELRAYLHSVLDQEPVAVGPGIFFVFKDENEEQHFLAHRVRNRAGLAHVIHRLPQPTREEREHTFYDTHIARFAVGNLARSWSQTGAT